MKWITAADLDAWSILISARTDFPGLIADLIRASSGSISSFRFPNGNKGQVRGFDGVLESSDSSLYVPQGKSIWEFGVGGKSKGDYEFDNRTNDKSLSAEVRRETTFVFVTTATWDVPKKKLENWLQEKNDLGAWREVRYIDGAMLEDWLEQCPAVAAFWARNVLGRYPLQGVRSTEEFWNDYSNLFNPPLSENVLLCDREEQAKSFIAQLAGGPQGIRLAADSLDEVIAFAVAAIRNCDPEVRYYLEAKTLIIESKEAVSFIHKDPKMIYLTRGQAVQNNGILTHTAPTVTPLGSHQPGHIRPVQLVRPSNTSMGKALATMGYPEQDAYELARKCGRSVSILSRMIPAGGVTTPQWVGQGKMLVPALLAGGWKNTLDTDKGALKELASVEDYYEYEGDLRTLLPLEDSPLEVVQDVWKIRAPVDAFTYLGSYITADYFERFRSVATKVFSHIQPKPNPDEIYQLDKRYSGEFSEWLREGVATTLLQIAVLSEQARLTIHGVSPQGYVDGIVRSLPGLSENYRLMESLDKELPLIAEAAPTPFLEALEHMLEGNGDAIRPIFNESEGYFVPQSSHTGMLWALETLAWDPEVLCRVTIILARLAAIDPGGRISNRPINSLRGIFLPWGPNTNANITQRLIALDQIIDNESSIAWELLVKLLPRLHDTSSHHPTPKHREAGASDNELLTYGVVWKGEREIVSRALSMAVGNPERLVTIIGAVANFEPELRGQCLNAVDEYFAGHKWDDDTAVKNVWSALRDEVNRHKSFANAEWAIPKDELSRFESIVQKYQPDNMVEKITWLFDDWDPYLPDVQADDRFDKVESVRDKALHELMASQGVEGLLTLATSVKHPHLAVGGIIKSINDSDSLAWLISNTFGRSEDLNRFASSLSAWALNKFGDEWVKQINKLARDNAWSPEQMVTMLLSWQDTREIWDRVSEFGGDVEKEYWIRKQPFGIQGTREDLEFAGRQYLKFGRASAGIDALSNHAGVVSVELLYELLDAAVTEINAHDQPLDTMFTYHVGKIFENLASREDAVDHECAKREYAYLPLLEYPKRPLILHRLLAEDPGFYMSVICDVFKASSQEDREASEEAVLKARIGYQLLNSFKKVPGETNNDINVDKLRTWIYEVRRLAVKADRAVITDQFIGHVLAHAEIDKGDGAWPDLAIRIMIEELNSSEIERGIEIERLNMRGPFTKAIFEGGKQERELAEKYLGWAKKLNEWPKTSALLKRIVEDWKRDGEREDIEAEKDKMRW